MAIAILSASILLVLASVIHLASIGIALARCRPRAKMPPPKLHAPAVTIIRPVCGLENFIEETLRSTFLLDYPRLELLFCAARADDPVIPLVRRLMADYPWIDARLLIGDERISGNPKLNNMFKGWREARHDWIVFADSNVAMPRDYVQRLLAGFRGRAALVCSPPIGSRPHGFWAEVECAFLNTYQARWQYVADSIGMGFAQGKTMMWRRADLEHAGGIRVLGSEVAEDAASTKAVRAMGHTVRLIDDPFRQPLGARSAGEVWRRQMRWAQLRRASFPLQFAPEIVSGGVLPIACVGGIAAASDLPAVAAMLAFAGVWYGAEVALAWFAHWHVSRRTVLAAIVRDLLIPVLWIGAWRDTSFVWRGNEMSVADEDVTVAAGARD
ncbi:MAG: glycosyltransferase [Pseudorhodoplanes sp.]|nr:glycosyltransferase [Pseudorhodoplanes sp.]